MYDWKGEREGGICGVMRKLMWDFSNAIGQSYMHVHVHVHACAYHMGMTCMFCGVHGD